MIATGSLAVAPEAAAGEAAPQAEVAASEGEAAPQAEVAASEGEVAPQVETEARAATREGEVAPQADAAASEGSEPAPRHDASEGSEPAPRDDASEGSEPAPRDDASGRETVHPAGGDGQAHGSGTSAPPRLFRGTPRAAAVAGERAEGRLSQYLQRSVRYGAHFLDHGVLQPAIVGGWPHGYRLELSLGLLDHLTIGATAHWLPGQRRPQVAPIVAIAILRGRLYEFGVWHFWSLFPPPRIDADPTTPSYPRRAQWYLATASFGQAWLTGGFDAGVVRARQNDPAKDPAADTSNPSTIRWRFGGGLHLRAGTRRWGFTAQVLVPELTAELRFDVRIGLVEKRSKGGWKPYGKPEDWDRGAPW